MRSGRGSLQEEARYIFGEDREAIRHWVEYWERSRERNRQLLASFDQLILLDFRFRNVLDIGCGTGGLGEILGDKPALYVGADYNLHVLKFADSGPRRKYLQCSGVSLPFRDASVDFIFAFDVLEHIQGGDQSQIDFLAEMGRVLNPAGMIFLTTPNLWYPYEGHSRTYFPQYLPRFLADRYIGWLNPGFLKEHHTFAEIRSLTPRKLRRYLRQTGLTFLHDLPCGLDRRDLLRQSWLSGVLAYLGLGWYPHAEFWGILVRPEAKPFLRRKLKHFWFFEQNQPSRSISGFQPHIDFDQDAWGYQLGAGWYWHERNGRGFRWVGKSSQCYLETAVFAPRFLQIRGYSPIRNRLEVSARVPGSPRVVVGEHFCRENEEFMLEYLVPFKSKAGTMLEVGLSLDRTFSSVAAGDRRELGVMIFRVEALS
jgi:SAM-dependent methyltransferase